MQLEKGKDQMDTEHGQQAMCDKDMCWLKRRGDYSMSGNSGAQG